MSQPIPADKNQSSKMKKLLSGEDDKSPLTHLQRSSSADAGYSSKAEPAPKPQTATPVPGTAPSTSKADKKRKADIEGYRFLPAFWTIASILSFGVNIVLILILLLAYQNFRSMGVAATDLGSYLLGGLYNNFVKMDQAHIVTTIPVSKEIPVNFVLDVSGPTNVTLSGDVRIDGALVTVNTGGLNITNARASIVLPQGTVLPIQIESLMVPVDQKVLAELNVPVDIPLNQTDLHEPFVGLQQVVEPFYCLIEPQAQVNGVSVCQ
jgi:hypothetical protein